MTGAPSVLFICVKNGGKSQMAAGLMRQLVGDRVRVQSAGTHPGPHLNDESVEVLLEVDVDIRGETPKLLTGELLAAADRVIVLGREAHVGSVADTQVEYWDVDEPSERGIEGVDRMRLVRDGIAARVGRLAADLADSQARR